MSGTRRSGRTTKRLRDEVPSWAKAGLPGLIAGNEASLCKMLDAKGLDQAAILEKLVEVCLRVMFKNKCQKCTSVLLRYTVTSHMNRHTLYCVQLHPSELRLQPSYHTGHESAKSKCGRSSCTVFQRIDAQRLRERGGEVSEGKHSGPSGANQLTLATGR